MYGNNFPDVTERQVTVKIFKRIFENIEKIEIKALGGRKIILSLGVAFMMGQGISAMIPFTARRMQPCTGAKNNRDFVLRYMGLRTRFLYLNCWAESAFGYRPDAGTSHHGRGSHRGLQLRLQSPGVTQSFHYAMCFRYFL